MPADLGYPSGSAKYLRVRKDIEDFVYYNKFGNNRKALSKNAVFSYFWVKRNIKMP